MEGDKVEQVHFYNQIRLEKDVENTYNTQKERIKKVIPDADIQHVGSSAVPNSLTKGDLDIQVRVSSELFLHAVDEFSELYDINEGSIKTNEFRAFKDDIISPPLGIQLTVFDSEFDFFWRFRDILLQNDKYRMEYDNLKRKFEGKEIDEYREAKNDFFNRIKKTKEYQELEAKRVQ